MENDLKGIENYFELTGGSSYRESTVYISAFAMRLFVLSVVFSAL